MIPNFCSIAPDISRWMHQRRVDIPSGCTRAKRESRITPGTRALLSTPRCGIPGSRCSASTQASRREPRCTGVCARARYARESTMRKHSPVARATAALVIVCEGVRLDFHVKLLRRCEGEGERLGARCMHHHHRGKLLRACIPAVPSVYHKFLAGWSPTSLSTGARDHH